MILGTGIAYGGSIPITPPPSMQRDPSISWDGPHHEGAQPGQPQPPPIGGLTPFTVTVRNLFTPDGALRIDSLDALATELIGENFDRDNPTLTDVSVINSIDVVIRSDNLLDGEIKGFIDLPVSGYWRFQAISSFAGRAIQSSPELYVPRAVPEPTSWALSTLVLLMALKRKYTSRRSSPIPNPST